MRHAGTELQSGEDIVMRRLIRLSVYIAVTAVTGFFLLLTASIYSFYELTDETLIAELEFDRIGDRQYLATLRTGDFCSPEPFTILGDQWRVDAQFLKWHYLATMVGLGSHYRLERLEGRYRDAGEQNSLPTLAHALAEPSAIDIGALTDGLGKVNFLADASYGSSTYHDINPGLVYRVYKSPTGLLTRTRARVSVQEDVNGLTVDVRRGCAEGPGMLAQAAGWINRSVDRVD
jgi:hypothetical protein